MNGRRDRAVTNITVGSWKPWTGFPIQALVDLVQPLASAKYLNMVTFHDPQAAPGLRNDTYPWPYHEGLSMAEATNELSLFVTGIYGHELTKQHGARFTTPDTLRDMAAKGDGFYSRFAA